MKTFPSERIDFIFTDPPFNISTDMVIKRSKHLGRFRGKNISYDFGEWDKFDSKKDYLDFTFAWVRECARVMKGGASFVTFLAKEYISYIWDFLESVNIEGKNILSWVITNPVPHVRKVQFMSGVCLMVWGVKKGKRHTFNYKLGQHPNYTIYHLCQGKERLRHPTQKPEAVVKWLVSYLSNENDVVLDPFVGSGTTCVVAKKLGRKWIGIDINPEYVEMSKKRISQVPEKLEKYFCG